MKPGRPSKGNELSFKMQINNSLDLGLKSASTLTGKSRAEIVRGFIESIGSNDFNQLLSSTELEYLEAISIKAWNDLHVKGSYFSVDNISEQYPCYIIKGKIPLLCVKYPIYRLQIYVPANPGECISVDDINNLLGDLKDITEAYHYPAQYVVVDGDIREKSDPFIVEVSCLTYDLAKGEELKNIAKARLKEQGFEVIVYPGYCLRHCPIQLDESGRFFTIIQ